MPIDIDNTDVSDITIDGQNVEEVTADGNVVWNAITDSALTPDLIAWYRFEDGDARDYTATLDATFADTTAYDGTVNGATYQSSGGVTDFESGVNSGAFDFDGSNDGISINNAFAGDFGSSSFSICAWVKSNDVDGGSIVANRDFNSGFAGFFCEVLSDDRLKFTLDNGSSTEIFTETDNSIVDGSFQHFTFIRNNGASETQIYVDGSQVSVSTSGGESDPATYGDISVSGENTDIGFEKGNNYLDATIDDVRLYNKALSSSEVSKIYNNTKP